MTRLTIGDRTVTAAAVVFDKDGTLVDLHALWGPPIVEWIERLTSQVRMPELVAPILDALGVTVGARLIPNGVAASRTWAEAKAAVADVLEAGGVAAAAHRVAGDPGPAGAATEVHSVGDVAGAMRTLVAAGLAIGVVTSDDRVPTLNHLVRLGVVGMVGAIVCGDDGLASKPAPDTIERALEVLGVEPRDAVMVGDSEGDMTAGRAAGVALCVGVTGGGGDPIGADVVVPSVDAMTPM